MTENMRRFLEAVSASPEMQEQMNRINRTYYKDMLDLAGEFGLQLTEEDLKDALHCAVPKSTELNEEELESVSGGKYVYSSALGCMISNCTCVVGGGGTADENQRTCVCVFGGCGDLTDLGIKKARSGEIDYVGKISDRAAMVCALVGCG